MQRIVYLWLAIALFAASLAFGQEKSFTQTIGSVSVGPVNENGPTQVGYLFWGGDLPVLMANGGNTVTAKGSIYADSGLNLKLVQGDDFPTQVKDYLSGKTPYLRGTLHMLALASEVINKDPRTKPIVILQESWSLGDHMVGRAKIKTLNDIVGKKICLQEDGPHIGLIDDSLKAINASWDDITVVWTKDLTGKDGPAEMMKKDPSIDVACVISPDMIGLCGGIDQVGSGADDTLEGAHVVNSTSSMNHSIADMYVVRSDYFKAHRDKVEKFVAGYFKATEQLIEARKVYDNGKGKSQFYVDALKLAQNTWGVKSLPTLEVDAHGLVLDVDFARIPGNEAFFNDPSWIVGFTPKSKSALEVAEKLGYIKNKLGFEKANWDYKKLSEMAGVKYVAPVFSTGRVKVEISDFNKDLDDNTILTFDIKFSPEQTKFDVDAYAAEFQRVCETAATFGNTAIFIRGHADPTIVLRNFVWAAKAKGILQGNDSNYSFNGKAINLNNTNDIIKLIQSETFTNLRRRNSQGQIEDIEDPRTTVAGAQQLSLQRANSVKKSLQQYAESKGLSVDFSQIQPQGVGVAEPVIPRPRNTEQALQNMRVEFRVVRLQVEAISEDSFDFDK